MTDTIMGSETEFGWIIRSGLTVDERFLLNLERYLCSDHIRAEDVLGRANWWEENVSSNESIDAADEHDKDVIRRMGASGMRAANGARMYVDVTHPEFSTPECSSPRELVAHERAGERMMSSAVNVVCGDMGIAVDLLKRNWDYHGASYACHENYCISRRLFGLLCKYLLSREFSGYISHEQAILVFHLATRQIMTGSGRIDPSGRWPECFSLSQRQPFIESFESLETTRVRPIINTRNRPYADPHQWARLHVICGDSNRTDWSNVLKYGTTSLMLHMLEDWPVYVREKDIEPHAFTLRNPMQAFREVRTAHDRVIVLESGLVVTPLEAQQMFVAELMRWNQWRQSAGREISWANVLLNDWARVLKMLDADDRRLDSMLDYRIKRAVFESRISEGKSIKTLQALEYHYQLVGNDSLFEHLLRGGQIEQLISEDEIQAAIRIPPHTRAALRARIQQRADIVYNMSWHYIYGKFGDVEANVGFPDPFGDEYTVDPPEVRNLIGEG